MKRNLEILLLSLVSPVVFGQWQLIDDFEQWEPNATFIDTTEIGWHASSTEQSVNYWMLQDPFDPENTTLYVQCPTTEAGWVRTYLMKAIPGGGISPGETGTLFVRSLWQGYGQKWSMATADKPLVYDEETGLQTDPGSLGDLNARVYTGTYGMTTGEGQVLSIIGAITHRDGEGWAITHPPQIPQVSIWYSFWMVVENTWDMSTTPPTCTGVYTLYAQGEGFGDGVSPTLIPVGTDPSKDSALLSRAPVDEEGNPRAIIWAVFTTESQPPGSPGWVHMVYMDDFYFSNGKNLTNPLDSGSWGPIVPVDLVDVDTGPWMGWINVSAAPFLYLYSLSGWVYMEDFPTEASGAWGYFYK